MFFHSLLQEVLQRPLFFDEWWVYPLHSRTSPLFSSSWAKFECTLHPLLRCFIKQLHINCPLWWSLLLSSLRVEVVPLPGLFHTSWPWQTPGMPEKYIFQCIRVKKMICDFCCCYCQFFRVLPPKNNDFHQRFSVNLRKNTGQCTMKTFNSESI